MFSADGWLHVVPVAAVQLPPVPCGDHRVLTGLRLRERGRRVIAHAMRRQVQQSRNTGPAIWNISIGDISQVGVHSFLGPGVPFSLLFAHLV